MAVTYIENKIIGKSYERQSTLLNDKISKTGLKAYWRLNETSGDIINRASDFGGSSSLGSNADGQVDGMNYIKDPTSKLQYSGLFDGTNDKVDIGSSTSQFNFMHNSTARFTVTLWAKVTATSGNEAFLGDHDSWESAQNVGFNFGHTASNDLVRVGIGNGTNPVCLINTTGWIPDHTNWHFYSITYDQSLSSNNMNLKVDNGSLLQGTKTSETPSSSNSAAVMRLGKDQHGSHWLTGSLAEVAIWDRVLTDAEITDLYTLRVPANTIFIEVDTGKQYIFDGTDWDLLP